MLTTLKQTLLGLNWKALAFKLGSALGVLILAWLVLRFIDLVLRRFERRLVEKDKAEDPHENESAKRAETLVRLLRQGAHIAVWVVAMLTALSELGVNIGPIMASAGIVGLAVGFGAQNLVRDVISGFFIVLENQVRVGDVASINGTSGLVEKINLRTVVLRDLSGTVHVFPNGAITTLSNMTKEWSAYVFDLGVAYKEDVDRVIDVIREVAAELRTDPVYALVVREDVEVLGVNQLGDSAVVIRGRIKTVPGEQWQTGRQFLRRIKKRFDAEGIEIPFPHRTIYVGEATSALAVKLEHEGAPEGGVPSAQK
ncbi:MAG: mechanosensitive ion channel family protein [Pseudomonadota bacterium]